MGYLVLENVPLGTYERYSLQLLRPEDAETIRVWRNAQLPVLRQPDPIGRWAQQQYFRRLACERLSLTPPQILLGLRVGETLVGYGGLTHINWRLAQSELSYLGDPARSADDYYYGLCSFLEMLLPIAFKTLNLHRIWHEVYDDFESGRPRTHLDAIADFGFRPEGVLVDHAMIGERYVNSTVYGLLDTYRAR